MSGNVKRSKHITLAFADDGRVESVSVSTPLEVVYQAMFEEAEQDLVREPSYVANGIRVIIFGSFWIEALTNNVAKDFLWRFLGTSPIRELVWRQLKKSSTYDKLDFIAGLCSAEEANDLRLLAPRVRAAFDLRNRLAHFRAEEELVGDAPDNIDEILAQLTKLPETELEGNLEDAGIMNDHARAFRAAADWMQSVRSTTVSGRSGPARAAPGSLPSALQE